MRPRRAAVLAAFFLLQLGCTSHSARGPEVPELGWPPQAPRVRLDRILSAQAEGGVGRLFRWVSGDGSEPLFHRPHGVAWQGDGLLVTDPGAQRVVRIDSGGRVTLSPSGAIDNPIGVAACADGIVVTDSRAGRVALLDQELRRVAWLADGLIRPTAVACVGERLFVVETGRHRLLVRDADGDWTPFGGRGESPGQFNFPTAMAADAGSLWVGDTLNFRVQRLDLESSRTTMQRDPLVPTEQFGELGDTAGAMPRLKGMTIDRDGHLWVSDAWLDQVSLYTREGDLLMSLGGKGDGPGRFAFPAGLDAHPDGRVAVVDALNRRLQVFRLVAVDGR